MKIEELRNLNKDELLTKETQLKEEIFKLNYQRKIGRVEKPHRFKLLKKDVARIQTLLKEQEQEESGQKKT
ncbi:MAG: 50S ribosomal protein L29 [Candidatus Omnitrophica bacterium]|nr:50S ribosomal protein L29 [Candidatus Omnitrophota bacterium]